MQSQALLDCSGSNEELKSSTFFGSILDLWKAVRENPLEALAAAGTCVGLTILERLGRNDELISSQPVWKWHYIEGLQWEPLPGCTLPPPQPFYMEVGFATVRMCITAKVLSVPALYTWDEDMNEAPQVVCSYFPSLARVLEGTIAAQETVKDSSNWKTELQDVAKVVCAGRSGIGRVTCQDAHRRNLGLRLNEDGVYELRDAPAPDVFPLRIIAKEGGIPGWNLFVIQGFCAYQCSILVLSLGGVWYKFFTLGPFDSLFQGYNCMAILLTNGPWFSNCMELVVQLYITKQLHRLMRIWALSAHNKKERWTKGKGFLTEQKEKFVRYTTYASVGLFGLHFVSILITHILPSIIVFFPVMFYLVVVGVFLSWELQALETWKRVARTGKQGEVLNKDAKKKHDDVEKAIKEVKDSIRNNRAADESKSEKQAEVARLDKDFGILESSGAAGGVLVGANLAVRGSMETAAIYGTSMEATAWSVGTLVVCGSLAAAGGVIAVVAVATYLHNQYKKKENRDEARRQALKLEELAAVSSKEKAAAICHFVKAAAAVEKAQKAEQNLKEALEETKEAFTYSALTLLPIMLALRVVSETATLQAVYCNWIYGEHSWARSQEVVWAERKGVVYIFQFATQIAGHCWVFLRFLHGTS